MSRIYDFAVVGVVWLICYIVHYISILMFGPESALHDTASKASEFGGAAKADLWFQILSVWGPLIVAAGIVMWMLFREYRRGANTAAVPR